MRTHRVRSLIGIFSILALASAPVLSTSAASALENVNSRYRVGCSVYPVSDTATSQDPTDLTYDGNRTDVGVSVTGRRLTGSARAVHEHAEEPGEDCWVEGEFRDRLTVAAGSSGLADGAEIPVVVTVTLDAALAAGWGTGDGSDARANYDVAASVVSVDDCTWEGESGWRCDTPMRFTDAHHHYVYGSAPNPYNNWSGYVEQDASRDYRFTTNTGTVVDEYVDERKQICDGWPCSVEDPDEPPTTDVFTSSATVVVGDRYDVSGTMDLWTQGYGDLGVSGVAVVDDFSVSITPAAGYEGVDLDFASQPDPLDTEAPHVSAALSPEAVDGWHSSPVTVDLSASDDDSGVASITYSASGAEVIPPTTVTDDIASLVVGSNGVTEVTYTATDVAGNVSAPQTVTLRIDTEAPTLVTPEVVTATSEDGGAISVTYEASASDNLDPEPDVSCTPSSGSSFPVGSTTVACEAVDQAGNTANGSFTVTVTVAETDAMAELADALAASDVPEGLRTALLAKYTAASDGFASEDPTSGCGPLQALRNQVHAQTGKKIATEEAATLLMLIDAAASAWACV